MTFQLAIAAVTLGLLSSGHCLFMCGGISQALSSQTKDKSWLNTLLFHSGRISCYALLGLLLGSVIHQIAMEYHLLAKVLRHLSGVLLILIGLYIAGADRFLKVVEKRFAFIWKGLQPAVKKVLGMQRLHHAYALGFLWGFLPCGIIYSTLLWASTTTQGASASLVMLLFGLGTVPSFLVLGFFGEQLMTMLRRKQLRNLIGGLFVVFGLWTIAALFPNLTALGHPFC